MTDPRLQPGNCHKCGLPRSENPHPEAGKPPHYLEVGCPKECIPCLVLSRHQWAQRAMKAENAVKDLTEKQSDHCINCGLSINPSCACERGRKLAATQARIAVIKARLYEISGNREYTIERHKLLGELGGLLEQLVIQNDEKSPDERNDYYEPRIAKSPLPKSESRHVVGEQFTRAWVDLSKLPGGMMQSSEVGRFGPVAASTSCWITTSEKEAERMREKGPVLEIFTHPANGMEEVFDRQQAGFERCFEALGITDDRERSWSSLVMAINDALAPKKSGEPLAWIDAYALRCLEGNATAACVPQGMREENQNIPLFAQSVTLTSKQRTALEAAIRILSNGDYNSNFAEWLKPLLETKPAKEADDSALRAIMERDAWRNAMVGLCNGSKWPTSPDEAAAHLRARLHPAKEAEPVATLHDDGHYTWHGDKPLGFNYAGWRMKVYCK